MEPMIPMSPMKKQLQTKEAYVCPSLRSLELEAVKAFATSFAQTTILEVESDAWGVVDNEVSFE